jgi:TolB-like protein
MMRWTWLLAILLSGCVAPGPTYEKAEQSELIKANYAAADRLYEQGKGDLDPDKPILTATLVSIDDLNQSSRLGRLISEQFASRFAQQGMTVVEMKMRGNIFVQRSVGELLLSREVQDISASHHAQAVVVGTYATAQDYVYVTVKLVRSVDNEILAAHDYALPLDGDVLWLLPARR